MITKIDEALSYLESYTSGVSYDKLDEAINFIATKYVADDISWNFSISDYDCDRFDKDIKAFSYFWKYKYKSYGYDYDNFYIKAMLGVESTVGTLENGQNHGTTDVMQCLDGRNPAVYCMAKIAPANSVPYDKNEGILKGMRKDGFRAVRNLFDGQTIQPDRITPRMSICFGILWLGFKTSGRTIEEGIVRYNSKAAYLDRVKSCRADPKAYFGIK